VLRRFGQPETVDVLRAAAAVADEMMMLVHVINRRSRGTRRRGLPAIDFAAVACTGCVATNSITASRCAVERMPRSRKALTIRSLTLGATHLRIILNSSESQLGRRARRRVMRLLQESPLGGRYAKIR
jgi:hypothetical protein